jgi:L-fuculose-phosphate aldolase
VSRNSLRADIVSCAQRMNSLRINRGTSGNVSARSGEGFLITPTGLAYEAMLPEDLGAIAPNGEARGTRKPSSEWRFHLDIYAARSEVGAIVHAHSTFATALSCLRRAIPAFHYMVAIAGGNDIRCAEYATFGTQALSDNALAAIAGRRACLLANHGMIAVGASLEAALALAVEVEALAEQYWCALQIGEPNLLCEDEMQRVLENFRTYGQKNSP